ncbi:MAG: YtxH domain-containing protein [Leucobacter sp.]
MKGKIAFVLGAAVGYVLGTRAGRERYEQIKRGAQAVWATPTVQRGVQSAQDAVGDRVDELKSTAFRAGKDAFTAFARGSSGGSQNESAASKPATSKTTESKATASKTSSTKSSGSKSSGSKSSGSRSSGSNSSSTKQGGSRSGAKPKGGDA